VAVQFVEETDRFQVSPNVFRIETAAIMLACALDDDPAGSPRAHAGP
jgi:hypothetical protein